MVSGVRPPHLQQCAPRPALAILRDQRQRSRYQQQKQTTSHPFSHCSRVKITAWLFWASKPTLQQQCLTAEQRFYKFTAALPLQTTSGGKDWGSNWAFHPRGTLKPALAHTDAIPIKPACCGASFNQTWKHLLRVHGGSFFPAWKVLRERSGLATVQRFARTRATGTPGHAAHLRRAPKRRWTRSLHGKTSRVWLCCAFMSRSSGNVHVLQGSPVTEMQRRAPSA